MDELFYDDESSDEQTSSQSSQNINREKII